MVKPPKTMQPEAVNLSKAGRDKSRGFQEDSFHNYMARKIACQRQQRGLVLPPPPPEETKGVRFAQDVIDHDEKKKRKRSIEAIEENSEFRAIDIIKKLQKHGRPRNRKKVRQVYKEMFAKRHCEGPNQQVSSLFSQDDTENIGSIPELKAPDEVHDEQTSLTSHLTQSNSISDVEEVVMETKVPLKDRPDLFFDGVVVLVNGYTNPDSETIQRLMHKHGGDLEKYETSRVTHIIAEQLSTAKANMYKRQRKPLPVCHPSWIVKCVNEQRLLSYGPYLLRDDKSLVASQRSLASFLRNSDEDKIQAGVKSKKLEDDPPMDREVSSQPDSRGKSVPSVPMSRYINGRERTVGTDPNFLDSFFSNSRLSFIGSFKQRVRQSPTKKESRVSGTQRFVFLVDMDSFFVSVSLRRHPQYRGRPVAISHLGKHNDSPEDLNIPLNSTSECATCNYEARKYGVTKGMYLGRAKALCPDLVVLPYEFDGYEEVSEEVVSVLFRHATLHNGTVEQVSCDEAYMELNLLENGSTDLQTDARVIAEDIRREIYELTECTATIGVSHNKLLAKLAADRAKPNGCLIAADHRELLKSLDLRQLYGVGYRLERKLKENGLVSVRDIWDLGAIEGKKSLCRILGPNVGERIFSNCHGKDDRVVQASERKTIGAECNYGVRFDGPYGVEHMVNGLAKEVEKRMELVGVYGSKVTLKVKQRKDGAPPPPKFLGHGSCHNLSKSKDAPQGRLIRDAEIIFSLCWSIFIEMDVRKEDIRGMGIIVSKLADDNAPENLDQSRAIMKWLGRDTFSDAGSLNVKDEAIAEKLPCCMEPSLPIAEETTYGDDEKKKSALEESVGATSLNDDADDDIVIPPLSQIHMSQVEVLPPSIQRQVLRKMQQLEECTENSASVQEPEQSKESRFRQTDVKRMMRLATFKCSNQPVALPNGDAVSLSQLESLSLEMQLQIVNNDKCAVGIRDRVKKSSKGSDRKHNNGRGRKPAISSSKRVVPDRSTLLLDFSEGKQETFIDRNTEHSKYTEWTVNRSLGFFGNNVQPFREYLDIHSPTDSYAVRKVEEFLSILVCERQLSEVVVLLRHIKNGDDTWATIGSSIIIPRINNVVKEVFGRRIDLQYML